MGWSDYPYIEQKSNLDFPEVPAIKFTEDLGRVPRIGTVMEKLLAHRTEVTMQCPLTV